MFNPSREAVRRFFCEARRKERSGEIATPLEAIAVGWIRVHPEYHALLDDPEGAVAEDYSVERGQSNPFLHLSMHVALDEQVSIDQPPGVRALLAALTRRHDDPHEAAHQAMECLASVLWQTQRGTLPADPAQINAAYLECLRRRVG
jgi:hypothetical protein